MSRARLKRTSTAKATAHRRGTTPSRRILRTGRRYSASTVIQAQRRVLNMARGIIYQTYRGTRAAPPADLLITDGSSLFTLGEAIDQITQAIKLKVQP